jgi:peptide/nickel transport system ATP-binding protein
MDAMNSKPPLLGGAPEGRGGFFPSSSDTPHATPDTPSTSALLSLRDLRTHFRTPEGPARAVDGVSFDIPAGETYALVGESGCGKSVTALSILRLVPEPPGYHAGGGILFDGHDLARLPRAAMRSIRGDRISMIFQEPMTALNPVLTIGNQVGEVLMLHRGMGAAEARRASIEILNHVGIPDAGKRVDEYPHQFSGGMRQRVMIAMALACRPDLLIADEPTTALDVTIQDQILALIRDLRREFGTAVLLITHDMGVVYENADRVGVMYAGRVVEEAAREVLFREPAHPYTQLLMEALPSRGTPGRALTTIPGRVPKATHFPEGCRFNNRCPYVMERCRRESPPAYAAGPGHTAECFLLDQEEARKGRGSRVEGGEEPTPRFADPSKEGRFAEVSEAVDGEEPTPRFADPSKEGRFAEVRRPGGGWGGGIPSTLDTRHSSLVTRHIPSPEGWPKAGVGSSSSPLLSVRALTMHFLIRAGLFKRVVGRVRAVDGVDFTIRRGETLALVGESGCGKTTVGKCLVRLLEPTGGEIVFDGDPIGGLKRAALKPYRRRMQMIFQDPYSSLNPRRAIGHTLMEGMETHGVGANRADRIARLRDLLPRVGLDPDMVDRYPHEFSGGQRQRIGLARALAVEPGLIVCDEATSSLDVSVQAQILNLLRRLQTELGLAYLFISHDISVIRHISDRTAVMYLGRIVETGATDPVTSSPAHPYTRALMAAVPRIDGQGRVRLDVAGDVPSPAKPPPGCPFHPRCPYAIPACADAVPPLEPVPDHPDRLVACNRKDVLAGT